VRGDDDVLRIPALANLPWFLPGFAVSVVVGHLVRHRAARFLGASPILGWAVVVSLGIVVSATLTPLHEGAFEGGAQAAGCDFSRVGLASLEDILELGDTFLNILLFIPLGVTLALLPRSQRKAWLMAVALALPLVIETTQLIATPLDRACQSADVVDNVSGLLIGFVVGSVAGYLVSRASAASGRRAD
jgi:glycopeptide antibiotics resistance protein